MFNFNISKTTIYTQVCCGYPSLGRLCWLGFRGSLHWNCYRRVFHVYASSVRCPFVFLFYTLDILDAQQIVIKKFETYSPFSPGYSWLASKVDLTGNGNSFIFLGTNLGWLIFPPIAGLVIFSGPGGVGVFLMAFGEKCLKKKCFCTSLQAFQIKQLKKVIVFRT